MRLGRTSITSSAVATLRAAASLTQGAACNPSDALARQLLPAPMAGGVSLLQRAGPRLQRLAFGLGMGLGDHIALRSAAIDGCLRRAVEGGIRQVLILGAGLDTRAYRLAELASCNVFEVDHVDTQRVKRERSRDMPVAAGALTHVAVDFSRDDLASLLVAAGFDATQPSFCIWEGVTMYLTAEASSATLGALAQLSPPASQLAVTYMCEDLIVLRHTRRAVQMLMRAVGEPLLGVTTPDQMHDMLASQGWRLREDTDTHDWAARHASSAPAGPLIAYERLALAHRL